MPHSSRLDANLSSLKALLDAVQDPLIDDWDPIELSLLLANLEYEDLNIETYRAQFRGMVQEIEREMPRPSNHRDRLAHVIHAFSKKFQFEGDKTNYYNIKNSFLNDVLTRRKGIPISLSLVFMGLCRGVGLKAVGISFPGHFLVRLVPSMGQFEASGGREEADDWMKQTFVDCFDGGALLTVQDCERRLFDWTRGVVPFGPEALKVAHPREIVSRMLRNLRAIFMEKEDLARLYWVLSALIELCPGADAIEAHRDRGILYGRTGRFRAAVEDLKVFLSLCVDPVKRSHAESLLRLFESQRELPN